MQRLEVSGAVGPIYGSLGVKRLSDVKRSVSDAEGSLFWVVCDELILAQPGIKPNPLAVRKMKVET